MKSVHQLLLYSVLLVLSSCDPDPGPGGGTSNPSIKNSCLEKNLKWIKEPPQTKKDFFKSLNSNYHFCFNRKDNSKDYSDTIIKQYPRFFDWVK